MRHLGLINSSLARSKWLQERNSAGSLPSTLSNISRQRRQQVNKQPHNLPSKNIPTNTHLQNCRRFLPLPPSCRPTNTQTNKKARGRARKPFSSFSGPDAERLWTYNEIRADATETWLKDPLFKDSYHETGYILAASDPKNIQDLIRDEQPTPENGFTEVNSAAEFRNLMPKGVLTGDFPNWRGWFKASGAGWCHARNALVAAASEAEKQGVKIVESAVTSLIIESNDVKGAKTADGAEYRADRTILCAGANAPQLIDMQDQLRPTAWTLAHIAMTEEECALYKDLPVLFNMERGFFMEPDADNHELKICDEHPGYTNFNSASTSGAQKKASVPFSKHQIPLESEQGVRQFLRETMPQLADRPFSFARICWCADTPNRDFLISAHPDYPSLTLGVGASGHGFMHIPVVGKYIVQCLEGKLDPKMQRSWRWRPETAVGRDWDALQGRGGGPNRLRDFGAIAEDQWTTLPARL